jgi:hypothetical protein
LPARLARILLFATVAATSLLCVPVSAFAAFSFLDRWGTTGGGAGDMLRPDAVGVGPNGHVYVGEYGGVRVDEFTSTGAFVRMWGKDVGGPGVNLCTSGCQAAGTGGGNGQFGAINDLDVQPVNGDVYVGDSTNRIQQFTATGTFIRTWGGVGTAAGLFDLPTGVDATTDAVYVADHGNARVQQFTLDGTFVRMWGGDVGGLGVNVCTAGCGAGVSGGAGGQFSNVLDVGVAPSGDLYAVDAYRVQQFTSGLGFLRTWGKDVGGPGVNVCTGGCVAGTNGSGDGEFDSPTSVAFDGAGNVWTSESNGSRLQEFGAAGAFIAKYGSPGAGSTQFDAPYGINFDCRGNLYVADFNNDRVQKLGEPGAGEPPCPPTNPPSTPAAGQIQSLALGSKKFKAARIGGAILSKAKSKVAIGTAVSYSLSAPILASFSVERATKGRKVGRKCKKKTPKNRKRPKCTLYKTVQGAFSHAGAAGPNKFKFSGRINNRALKPGNYRLVAITGSVVKRATFKIVR